MKEKKTQFGLGKGLSSLIQTDLQNLEEADEQTKHLAQIFKEIEISKIQFNPYQPRQDFDEKNIEELAESIRINGVIQPITLRRTENGYQLVSGERRIRAALKAGLTKIPAFIISVEEDYKMLEMALIENIQREDLNPIDLANGFKKLAEEFNFTQDEIANRVGKERSTITNIIRLLKLPIVVQDSLRKGEISIGHAKVLLSLNNDDLIKEAWKRIIENNLSVRQTEKMVTNLLTTKPKDKKSKPIAQDSNLKFFEQEISKSFGTKVKIEDRNKKGKIIIEYYGLDDFQRIVNRLLNPQ